MPLQDIAERARLFIKLYSTLDIDRFSGRDIDRLDTVIVPDVSKNRIGTADHDDILCHLFGKIMIDAVYLRLVKVFCCVTDNFF